MKFWQLLDIFRDEKDTLVKTFENKMWLNYLNYYNNVGTLVKNQQREILDKQVDKKLLLEICKRSRKTIFYHQAENKIYSYNIGSDTIEISIEEAVLKFNHDSLEEVFEKTEAIANKI